MRLYTFYSDSHVSLYTRFLSSITQSNPNVEIVVDKIAQDCATGEYMKTGWGDAMKNKVSQIIRAIDEGEVFVHSDCDIVYLKDIKAPLLEELGDHDIAFQNDGGTGGTWYCMGLFVCRPTESVRRLFTHVLENIDNFEGNDQLALNNAISDYKNREPGKNWKDVKYKLLSNKFYTYGLTRPADNMPWDGHQFHVSSDIITFHANWTKGINNKHKLLDYVSSKVGIAL